MRGIKNLKPSKSSHYRQGYVDPKSCNKLIPGYERDKIIYRSSYELKFITWMENSKTVKAWASECIRIPYLYIDGKMHNYYPDYFVVFENGTKMVVEIKPYSQTQPPINEANQWGMTEYRKNMCKWKATKEFCENKGYKFQVLTERTINRL